MTVTSIVSLPKYRAVAPIDFVGFSAFLAGVEGLLSGGIAEQFQPVRQSAPSEKPLQNRCNPMRVSHLFGAGKRP